MLPLDALVFNNTQIYIDHGGHNFGSGNGCIMEWVSVLQYGYACEASLIDRPHCTNRSIADAFITANDTLPGGLRQRLVPFILRIALAKRTSRDDEVSDRLQLWAARYAKEHLMQYMTPQDLLPIDQLLAEDPTDKPSKDRWSCWSIPRRLQRERGDARGFYDWDIDSMIDYLDALLDAHQKILAELGLMFEDEFCEFAESS